MNTSTELYLDHASTTPTAPDVVNVMLPYLGADYGNPSALHSAGRRSARVLQESRERVARILHAHPSEIFFTGSGTESVSMAILGSARANVAHGNHILVSCIEHKAVLESVRQLAQEGFEIEYIPVDRDGFINVRDVVARIRPSTILVSVMYANNEIGTIEPIQELAHAIRALRNDSPFPYIHTDACQAAGYLSLNVEELGVDLMSINSTKIYGPKGVGMLYKRTRATIAPLVFGGGQEEGLRSGTENIPGIVGFTYALMRADERKSVEAKRLSMLRDYCIDEILESIPSVTLNGHASKRLPNNIHISCAYAEGESLVLMLDACGIHVSTGSACSTSDLQPSHVLLAIKQDPSLLHGSLRITLGEGTTREMCEQFVHTLVEVVRSVRAISPTQLFV